MIADQSVHHVEGYILAEGHATQRLERDYGYDLLLFTYDEQGYIEPGFLLLQLKATETLPAVDSHYVFDLDIRDYNLWMLERMPVILILFDATRGRAYWLPIQRYFREDVARQPRKGTRTVRVRVPRRQVVNRRAIVKMREIKWETHRLTTGEGS
ncbi:MAG TPA: DUF4365 domain-containing protein [Gemmataceae bacterium]|nr:DUF4365 domain-containing protein [Gemmataceae bacterium]